MNADDIISMVGIRHYYCFFSGVNKQDDPSVLGVDNAKVAVEDEEYDRMMSRLDELEKEEELAARNDVQSDEEDEEDEEEKENSNESLEKFHDDKHNYSKVVSGLNGLT